MKPPTLYAAINIGFCALVAFAYSLHPASDVHPVYLILLFAICSSPIFDQRRLNDRYALLSLFSANYFLLFGVIDLQALVAGPNVGTGSSGGLSAAESVILVSGLASQLGYRISCRTGAPSGSFQPSDYPERLLVWGGLAVWAITTALNWDYFVNIMSDATVEVRERGLSSLGSLKATGYMVANYGQPLSIVVLAYAWCRYRRPVLVPILVAIVLVQLVLGFVADYKSQALLGAALVVLTRLLVDGKLPKLWILAAAALIGVVFPVLQANRAMRFDYHLNHAQAAQEIGKTLDRALASKEKATEGPKRMDTFFERMSLKGSVEVIVGKTGKEVAFQQGATLLPLVAVFVPRLLWPDKPSVETGRLVTSEFALSRSANLYTSPSHLGELYWNFGWPGAVFGLFIIGLLLGAVGVRSELSAAVTLTRVMVVMVTLQQLIMSFESSVAAPYAVWIRSLVGIGVLHLLFAKNLIPSISGGGGVPQAQGETDTGTHPPFSNLMR